MFTLYGESMNELYVNACKALILGNDVQTRGLNTREIMGAHICLTNPYARFVSLDSRAMDMRYCMGELCYFLDGRTDLASIYHYSKFWAKVSDDGKTVNSAYGYRLFYNKNIHNLSQLKYVISVLLDDPWSRKAVMPIYNKDDAHESKDNPCTMYLQFMIRNDRLHCHTHMRSNDIWLGLTYDVAFFTIVQEIIYTILKQQMPDLQMGHYYHNVDSFHAYERDWDGVYKCSLERIKPAEYAPPMLKTDTDGWFNDLLTYEKYTRGVVLYKKSGTITPFQEWCKSKLSIKA